MCVICELKAGYTLPYDLLRNAAHNNPHGFGVVICRPDGLDVIRDLPKDGNDPEVIYKILKENEEYDRYLHLRWKTQGDVSLENTQPFTVYDDGKRRIEFMHNGTLGSYSPPYQHANTYYGQHGATVTSGPLKSDSKKFSEDVLTEFLPVLSGENGPADIQDYRVQAMLDKYWSHGNRGILICNDLDPYFFNRTSWERIKTSEVLKGEEVTGEFLASNDDYFKELKRGPLHDKLKEAEREAEEKRKAKESAFAQVGTRTVEPGTVTSPGFFAKYSLSESMTTVLEDHDMYQAAGYVALANMTYFDLLSMITKTEDEDMASLMLYLTSFLKENTEKLQDALDELKSLKENPGLSEGVQADENEEVKAA
jgi:predicted glutamine amidotransferase